MQRLLSQPCKYYHHVDFNLDIVVKKRLAKLLDVPAASYAQLALSARHVFIKRLHWFVVFLFRMFGR